MPGDISVAGFDGIELSRFAVPRLTSVGQEQLDAGSVAWSLLHQRLDDAEGKAGSGVTVLEPLLGRRQHRPGAALPRAHGAGPRRLGGPAPEDSPPSPSAG